MGVVGAACVHHVDTQASVVVSCHLVGSWCSLQKSSAFCKGAGTAACSPLPAGCLLDVEIVTEAHCDAASAALYPTNAVRNRALRLVDTQASSP